MSLEGGSKYTRVDDTHGQATRGKGTPPMRNTEGNMTKHSTSELSKSSPPTHTTATVVFTNLKAEEYSHYEGCSYRMDVNELPNELPSCPMWFWHSHQKRGYEYLVDSKFSNHRSR